MNIVSSFIDLHDNMTVAELKEQVDRLFRLNPNALLKVPTKVENRQVYSFSLAGAQNG